MSAIEQATPRAYCAESTCNWTGELPAIAKCPACNSRQVRRVSDGENGEDARHELSMGTEPRALATSGRWTWSASVSQHHDGSFHGALRLTLYAKSGRTETLTVERIVAVDERACTAAIEMHASAFGVFLAWEDRTSKIGDGMLFRFGTEAV